MPSCELIIIHEGFLEERIIERIGYMEHRDFYIESSLNKVISLQKQLALLESYF